jgi:hypothetical protein
MSQCLQSSSGEGTSLKGSMTLRNLKLRWVSVSGLVRFTPTEDEAELTPSQPERFVEKKPLLLPGIGP